MARIEQVKVWRERLYQEGSPIVVEARALLKDQDSGKTYAQVKYLNVGGSAVTSLVVRVTPSGASGETTDPVEHAYQGLRTDPGGEFGSQEPVPLAGTILGFDVEPISTELAGGGSWHASDDTVWEALPDQRPLGIAIPDADDVDEYRKRLGTAAPYAPFVIADLWQCSCGHLNKTGAKICPACGAKRDEVLAATDSTRLGEAARKWKEERQAREYAEAVSLEEAGTTDSLRKASELFQNLGEYRDSTQHAADSHERYEASHKRTVTRRAFIGCGIGAAVIAGAAVYLNVILPGQTKEQLQDILRSSDNTLYLDTGNDEELATLVIDDVDALSGTLTRGVCSDTGTQITSRGRCTATMNGDNGITVTTEEGESLTFSAGSYYTIPEIQENLQGYWEIDVWEDGYTTEYYAQIDGDTIRAIAHIDDGSYYGFGYVIDVSSSTFTLVFARLTTSLSYVYGTYGIRMQNGTWALTCNGQTCERFDGPLPTVDGLFGN